MGWISRLEKRFGRYAIRNLMIYLIILYVVGFIVVNFAPAFYFDYLAMNPAMIMRGQVWRLITFIIFPPSTSILYFAIYMYMYYMLGSTLERVWGSFTFELYIVVGILGHILGAMVVYWVTGFIVDWTYSLTYLYMSLFLAFATTFPDATFLLFFFIPVKAKWLAILDVAYFVFMMVAGGTTTRIVAVLSLLNFLLFFISMHGRQFARNMKWKSGVSGGQKAGFGARQTTFTGRQGAAARTAAKAPSYSSTASGTQTIHKCAVCGITERDDPDMEFRYCSQCDGQYEYCMDHLFTHKHVKYQGPQYNQDV